MAGIVSAVAVFSPAKINLFLAITGRRPDGFHDLVSVAAPLEFGDTLWLESVQDGAFALSCTDAAVPLDESNLVLRAAEAFRMASGWQGAVRFHLEKRIPMGAGLGGGSSNAVAALRGLNRLAGYPLSGEQLERLAAGLGSDCVLFLRGGPVVMRGRGELVEALPGPAARCLRGCRLLVFKPDFGISTVWAYRQLAAGAPSSYLPEPEAAQRLASWVEQVRERGIMSVRDAAAARAASEAVGALLFNNMEPVAFAKYLALPVMLAQLRQKFGLAAGMSGSGSACFAVLAEDAPVESITERIRAGWGDAAFIADTRIC